MGLFDGPKLDKTVKHSIAPDEVIRRLQTQMEEKLQLAFPTAKLSNLQQRWSGSEGTFSCNVSDKDVTGTMLVSSSELRVTVQLPLGAGMVINTDEAGKAVARELTELLS